MLKITICLFLAPLAAAQTEALSVVRNASVPAAVVSIDRPTPKAEQGYLVTRSLPGTGSSAQVTSYSLASRKTTTWTIAPERAANVYVRDVSVAGDRVIAAVTFIDSTGSRHAALYILSANGSILRVVPTEPFSASRLAGTPQGDFWAFGSRWRDQNQQLVAFDCLLHFSREGTLIGSSLPRLSFPDYPEPSENLGGSKGMSQLVVDPAGISVYDAGSQVYMRLDAQGKILNHSPLVIPPDGATSLGPDRMVLLGGAVVVSRLGGGSLFRFDPDRGATRKIVSGGIGVLVGEDGGNLLYAKPTGAEGSLSWWQLGSSAQ